MSARDKEDVWTIERILKATQDYFAQKDIDSPRLDAELLLAEVLKVSRVYLYTHYDRPLAGPERDAYRALVKRRGGHEPVAYILGRREFYGRAFAVSRDVLVPRPETEHLVDAALAFAKERAEVTVLDVGTGSGIIAVTLALELPAARVTAVDLSAAALAVARQNAQTLGASVRLVEADLLSGFSESERFDLIVSNPPYVAQREAKELDADVRDFEPHLALFGGEDGLAVIRRLLEQAKAHLAPGGLLAFEIGAGQLATVRELCGAAGYVDVQSHADLQGHPRVVAARLARV